LAPSETYESKPSSWPVTRASIFPMSGRCSAAGVAVTALADCAGTGAGAGAGAGARAGAAFPEFANTAEDHNTLAAKPTATTTRFIDPPEPGSKLRPGSLSKRTVPDLQKWLSQVDAERHLQTHAWLPELANRELRRQAKQRSRRSLCT